MTDHTFPGDLSELEFIDAYHRSVLRKPQVIADAILKTLLHADAGDRALLTGAIAVELGEACRRLVAVFNALSDRRYTIAKVLMRELPGAQEWTEFAQQAGTWRPEQIVRELSLPDSALKSAELLRSQPDLGVFTELVAACESGSGMVIVPLAGAGGPTETWMCGRTSEGEGMAAAIPVTEADAAALADITADLVSIARGFLGAYLEARRGAGRRS